MDCVCIEMFLFKVFVVMFTINISHLVKQQRGLPTIFIEAERSRKHCCYSRPPLLSYLPPPLHPQDELAEPQLRGNRLGSGSAQGEVFFLDGFSVEGVGEGGGDGKGERQWRPERWGGSGSRCIVCGEKMGGGKITFFLCVVVKR